MNAFQPQAIRASTHFQHIELGPHFTLRYLMAKATQSCLYSKYEDCWLHFCRDNDLVEALAAQLSEAELDGLMVTEAENRIVASLRTIQTAHLSGMSGSQCSDEGPVAETRHLCLAMLQTASVQGSTAFLPASLCHSAQLAANILGQSDVEVSKLKKDTESLNTLSASLEENADSTDASAIERFFLQHPVGKALWDLAVAKVESGKKEAEAEEAVQKFSTAVTDFKLEDLGLGPSDLISDQFQPLKELWLDAAQKAKALKTKKGALAGRNADKINSNLDSVLVQFLSHVKEVSENLFSTNLASCLSLAGIRTQVDRLPRPGCCWWFALQGLSKPRRSRALGHQSCFILRLVNPYSLVI